MSAPQITTKIVSKSGIDWHRINIRVAATETPPPQEYAFAHFPEERGVYGMIIGPDGVRKSWLALQIAIGKAGGREIAGGLWPAPKPGRVVFFTGEDSPNAVWRRIKLITQNEADPSWIADLEESGQLTIVPLNAGSHGLTLICPGEETQFAQHSDVQTLIEVCKGAALIIVDPLADVVDASENDDVAARLLVQTLRSISRETGAALLIVHHQNKAAMTDGSKSNQTARGSSKIPAGCRWSVTLQPLSERETKEREVLDGTLWTKVHEGKAQYSARIESGEVALYHYPVTVDIHGKSAGGIPLARILPVKEEGDDAPKPSRTGRKRTSGAATRPHRGLGNVMGAGADEFDKRFADIPLPNSIPAAQEDGDDGVPF
ncbi:MAG: AAA family ATPase [Gammaproteobacteria bacterium]|jgi:hypothetical protein|nr:AAA family ATPase [Gammaproteobacteria bacterium]